MTESAAVANVDEAARKLGWKHFGILCAVLLVASVGWDAAMQKFGWWTRKEPVPWPANTVIDDVTFQNRSLPKQIGPYRRVEDTGLYGKGAGDGKIDGEHTYSDDVLESLAVATSLDEQRYEDRTSNWYVSRYYEDTRVAKMSDYRYWRLDINYYTGGEFSVPHTPEACLLAGGAKTTGRDVLHCSGEVAGVPAAWKNKPPLAAVRYLGQNGHQYTQYYVFAVNGLPIPDRNKARVELMKLWRRYIYFAKIQISPVLPMRDPALMDAKALEFYRTVLPAVLKELPTEEALQRMEGQD